MGDTKGVCSVGFYLMLALLLLIIPFPWLVAMFVAGGVHELCHFVALRFLTGVNAPIYLSSDRARMPIPDMPPWKEVLCAMAGPVGGLLLTFSAPIFPRLALCAMMQSLYNLIPIYPMDGGRIVSCVLHILLEPPMANKILTIVSVAIRCAILMLGVYGSLFLQLGIFPILFAALLCIRIK